MRVVGGDLGRPEHDPVVVAEPQLGVGDGAPGPSWTAWRVNPKARSRKSIAAVGVGVAEGGDDVCHGRHPRRGTGRRLGRNCRRSVARNPVCPGAARPANSVGVVPAKARKSRYKCGLVVVAAAGRELRPVDLIAGTQHSTTRPKRSRRAVELGRQADVLAEAGDQPLATPAQVSGQVAHGDGAVGLHQAAPGPGTPRAAAPGRRPAGRRWRLEQGKAGAQPGASASRSTRRRRSGPPGSSARPRAR